MDFPHGKQRLTLTVIVLTLALLTPFTVSAQGGPGTEDFAIRDFGACINLPDFTIVQEPDDFNTVYEVPGLFSINFAEYLLALPALPTTSDEIYNAMVSLLDTVNAGAYVRIPFEHPQYISAAVEFTLDDQRMFGMIYRNQHDKLFFLFADKVEGFDMLAIGRAIFAADRQCTPLDGVPNPGLIVADFDTCAGTNNRGGAMGSAFNAPDSLTESYEGTAGDCIARLEYDIEAWSAFWLNLQNADLTPYSQLVFDIKAESPTLRTVKLELKRAGGNEISTYLLSGISSTWQTVGVNLSSFTGADFASPLSALTAMEELVFVFEQQNTGPTGVIYLDNITFQP